MPAIPSARRNRIYENRNSDFICIEPYSLERNSTSDHQFHFYKGGPNDENIKLRQFRNCDPVYSSSSYWLDAGTQIATSEFHPYDHELEVTARISFEDIRAADSFLARRNRPRNCYS